MQNINSDKFHVIEPTLVRFLLRLENRLYDDRPLAGDERRDLANEMNAKMHSYMYEYEHE